MGPAIMGRLQGSVTISRCSEDKQVCDLRLQLSWQSLSNRKQAEVNRKQETQGQTSQKQGPRTLLFQVNGRAGQ